MPVNTRSISRIHEAQHSRWVLPLVRHVRTLRAALLSLRQFLAPRRPGSGSRLEEALRTNQERLQLAILGSNDGLWDWNLVDENLYLSPRALEIMGYGPTDEPAFRSLVEIVLDDDAGSARAAIQDHLSVGTPFDIEFRLRLKSGSHLWVGARGRAVHDANGQPMRMAGSISDIAERKRAEAAINHHALQQGHIAFFGQLALENPDIGELMSRAVTIVGQAIEADFCRLLGSGPDDLTLVLKAGFGWNPGPVEKIVFDAVAETEDHFIFGSRESLIVDDFDLESRIRISETLAAHGVRSGAEVLICGASGVYGVLGVYSRKTAGFTRANVDFLRSLANVIAAAIARKHDEERMAHMAQFDALTGLPNRNMYLDHLWQTILQAGRDSSPVGVLFVDLDRFKMVNDTLGHGAGDEVLLEVARRLRACVRACDTVGRLGGDEFAIALTNLTKAEDAGAIAQEVVSALSEPFQPGGRLIYVSASVGVSIFPVDGKDPDALLKNADTAMYRAKTLGRNNHQFYLPQMHERAAARLSLETELRGALDREEFRIHYQPKVNLLTGEISGLEALLRWQHPERGLVPPADFISILEDTGVIVPVGEWVIATVCDQIRKWQCLGLRSVPVAVNLSARQFSANDLDTTIRAILAASGVDPGLLEFELTESMLMTDAETAVQTMKNMKAFGVRLSVDDFGTGYSCLAYLKHFPLDSLKIDRAFIRDVAISSDDATIAAAIISLANSLKLNVVAEGVETQAQVTFLSRQGCNEMQGYFFSRPMPAVDCARALKEEWRLDRLSIPGTAGDLPITSETLTK